MRVRLLACSLLLGSAHAEGISASGGLEDCWHQWNQFWTANTSVSISSTLVWAPPTTTTYLTAQTKYSTFYTEYTTTSTHTRVQFLGPAGDPHAQTRTLISDIVETYNGPTSTPIDQGSSYTTTETQVNTASYYSIATVHANISMPSCTLPAQYPACQSQWDAWAGGEVGANGVQQPLCTQAKIEGSRCQTIITNYYSGIGVFGDTGIPGWVTSGESTFWPTTQSFAPGCTLGCQRCAIMGDKVRVLYWPASTATAVENGTATATFSTQASPGIDMSTKRTTIFEGSTLTSPTIYISYRSLYASDSCSAIGETFSNTIIPLSNSHDLHSLAYKALDDHGAGPGMNGIQYLSWEYEERPFNLTDLEEPIPDAIFDQLPYCQMQYRGYTLDEMQGSMSFSCTRAGPYNPIIAVPPEVINLDPAWKTCTGWYAGLYDPPRALQGAPSAATPTAPVDPTSASAQPVATVTDDAPRHTSAFAPTEATTTDPATHTSSNQHSASSEKPSSAVSGATNNNPFVISTVNIEGTEEVPTPHVGTLDGDRPSSNSMEQDLTSIGATLDQGATSNLDTFLEATTLGAVLTIDPPDPPTATSSPDPSTRVPPHAGLTTIESIAVATTFQAGGRLHTLNFESRRPDVDGTTLVFGQTTVLGTRTISYGVRESDVYVNGVRVKTTHSASSTHDDRAMPFTIFDEVLGPQVYTARTISGHPNLLDADGLTLTQGGPYQVLGYYLVSLGTGGVLYTVPIPRGTHTSSSATTTSPLVLSPTSVRLWTPSSALSPFVTSGARRQQPMWHYLVGVSLVALIFVC